MAKIAEIELIGCSGKKYTFSIYPITTSFVSLGGVYYISKRVDIKGIGNHTHIYLGVTDNLSTRFDNHHKQDCFEKDQANCVSILLCDDEDERFEIEKDLLCNYNFKCNEVLNN